jgi:hypothetical protein
MTIDVCSLLGGRITPGYLKSMIDLQRFCDGKRIDLRFHTAGGADIFLGRNICLFGSMNYTGRDFKLVKPFDGEPYEKIVWIDSDITFTPSQVLQLLSHDADIVSGLAMVTPERFAVGRFLPSGMTRWLTAEGVGQVADERLPNGLLPIDVAGSAFLAVRRGVLEQIGFPWYRTEVNGSELLGEDGAFCLRAARAGFRLYADLGIRVGHEKGCLL